MQHVIASMPMSRQGYSKWREFLNYRCWSDAPVSIGFKTLGGYDWRKCLDNENYKEDEEHHEHGKDLHDEPAVG